MRQAKQNVEKYYQVIGVTEKMNMTLDVLESKMPEYFENAKFVYHNDVMKYQWKNNYKPQVSDQVINILKRNFTNEIEFYEFCKQRLQIQYNQIHHY